MAHIAMREAELIPLCAYGLALMFWDQFYGISDSNLATPDHVTIQGERAAEFPRDVLST